MKVLALLCALIAVIAAEQMRFDDHRLYSLTVTNQEQLDWLYELEHDQDYLFWNSIGMGRNVDLMVSPQKISEFDEMSTKFGISRKLKIENVQELIDNERPKQQVKADRAFGWTHYMTYTEMYDWLDEMLIAYPNLLTNITIGTTYEGRTIRAVKLSYRENNPAFFIESNIHAREWITSATATWFLNELLTSTDPEMVDLAQTIDWYIIPVVNVDGFAYTHTVNRFWRKTRQPHGHLCYGADPNRNFDYNWRGHNGASDNPCSGTFAGPAPFSEPESAALANFVREHSKEIKIYLSLHASGQYILYPNGHEYAVTPHDDILQSIGQRTAEGFARRYNSDYLVGTIAQTLDVASGSSVDWAYGVADIYIAYAFELRDHRGGDYGFLLPTDQIIPNALETRDGIIAMVQEARRLNVL